jgi:aldehyde:ferredoxin oxidoreductase
LVYGWAGTILHIDLTKEKVSKKSSAEYTSRFLGARGTCAMLMYEESKPGQNAYDPETPIIVGAGALAGTGAPCSSRTEITTRYPGQESQGIASQAFGGCWAPELKFAGYDNLIITGKAKKPTYVYIENDEVKFKDATGIWGKGVFETNTLIKEELEDPDVKILCIGPAGERLVRCATIEHEYRGGTPLGAVMGSKKLKAVVVRGTKGVKVRDPDKVIKLATEHIEKLRIQHPKVDINNAHGPTAIKLHFEMNDLGVVGYYEGHEWRDLDKTSGEPFLRKYGYKIRGCYACPIACTGIMRVPNIGTSVMRCYPFWWVWMLWLTDMEKAFEAVKICSDYGLDHRELAHATAWLMRLYNDGIVTVKDTDGILMERGSGDALIQLIHKVANREGFGNILAEGTLKFARTLSPKAESYLVHRHGVPGRTLDYRVDYGKTLGEAVTTRAGTHRNPGGDGEVWGKGMKPGALDAAYANAKNKYGTEKAVIPWEYEGKAKLLVEEEHRRSIYDGLGVCMSGAVARYTRDGALEFWASMFSAATGLNVDEKRFSLFGEKIINLERACQAREGWTRNDDTMPEKFFTDPVPNGPRKGYLIDRNKFEKMKSEYYEIRGWDVESGNPTKETLERLSLKDIAYSLEKLGRLPKTQRRE